MNFLAIAAIIAMLYSVVVMWRNIDKELEKIEAGSKTASGSTIKVSRKLTAQPIPAKAPLQLSFD